MTNQLNAILIQLSEGKTLKLQFPSSTAMEAFRQAIYKEKKDFDQGMFAVMPEYEIVSLQFKPIGHVIAGEYKVELKFYKQEKKALQFTILEDESPS